MTRNTGGITVKRFVCMLLALVMLFGMCTAFGALAEEERKVAVIYNGKQYKEISLEDAVAAGYVDECTSFEHGIDESVGMYLDVIVYPCGDTRVPEENVWMTGHVEDKDCSEYAVLLDRAGKCFFIRLAKEGFDSELDTAAFFLNSGIETVVVEGIKTAGDEIEFEGATYHEVKLDTEQINEYGYYSGFDFPAEKDMWIQNDPLMNGSFRYTPNDPEWGDSVYFILWSDKPAAVSFWIKPPYRVTAAILPDGEIAKAGTMDEIANYSGQTFIYVEDIMKYDGQEFLILFNDVNDVAPEELRERYFVRLTMKVRQ